MWAELLSVLRDLLDWLWAIFKQWVPLVTGGAITAILAAVDFAQGKPVTWAVGSWFLVAFVVAAFLAWRKFARHTVCYINSMHANYLPAENAVLLVMTLTLFNPGEPSVFFDWEPSVVAERRPLKGSLLAIPEPITIQATGGGPAIVYQPQEALHIIALKKPVDRGGSIQGVMLARFPGVRDFVQNSIRVTFRDVNGRKFRTRPVVITSAEMRPSIGVGTLQLPPTPPALPGLDVKITSPHLPQAQKGMPTQSHKPKRQRRRRKK